MEPCSDKLFGLLPKKQKLQKDHLYFYIDCLDCIVYWTWFFFYPLITKNCKIKTLNFIWLLSVFLFLHKLIVIIWALLIFFFFIGCSKSKNHRPVNKSIRNQTAPILTIQTLFGSQQLTSIFTVVITDPRVSLFLALVQHWDNKFFPYGVWLCSVKGIRFGSYYWTVSFVQNPLFPSFPLIPFP